MTKKEKRHERYMRNREYFKQKQKEYYDSHKEECRSKARKKYVENCQEKSKKSLEYYYAHREEIIAKRSTPEYKEKRRLYQIEYRKKYC